MEKEQKRTKGMMDRSVQKYGILQHSLDTERWDTDFFFKVSITESL